MVSKLLLFAIAVVLVGGTATFVYIALHPYVFTPGLYVNLTLPHRISAFYNRDGTVYYVIESCSNWNTSYEKWNQEININFNSLNATLKWLGDRSVRWWTVEKYKNVDIYEKQSLEFSNTYKYWLPSVAYYAQEMDGTFSSIHAVEVAIDSK